MQVQLELLSEPCQEDHKSCQTYASPTVVFSHQMLQNSNKSLAISGK